MRFKFKVLPLLSVILFIFIVLIYIFRKEAGYLLFIPKQDLNQDQNQNSNKDLKESKTTLIGRNVEIVARNLNIPWEIAFLPGGDLLVTERPGKLLRIGTNSSVIAEIEGVKHIGEGGLLGLEIHPDFSKNNFIYLYSTTQDTSGISNRVERYKLIGNVLSERKVILEGIRGSANHDGGRMAFGPDGYLYITTGDAEKPNLAQDKNSLNGKILRIKDDGSIPSDNPFGNAVYSLGHRNPQGLAWDKNGTLWETEHGPSGTQTGYDEINIIVKGVNYGWPEVKGDQTKENFTSPILHSGPNDTWAPSGMTYREGNLFFSGLRGEALYEAKISKGNRLELITRFKREYGRIRAVVLGPDNSIYISTSNRDGRGRIKEGDDKIIKII